MTKFGVGTTADVAVISPYSSLSGQSDGAAGSPAPSAVPCLVSCPPEEGLRKPSSGPVPCVRVGRAGRTTPFRAGGQSLRGMTAVALMLPIEPVVPASPPAPMLSPDPIVHWRFPERRLWQVASRRLGHMCQRNSMEARRHQSAKRSPGQLGRKASGLGKMKLLGVWASPLVPAGPNLEELSVGPLLVYEFQAIVRFQVHNSSVAGQRTGDGPGAKVQHILHV